MSYPRTYNAAVDMVDRNVAEGRGDRIAFIDPTERLTYAELQRRCDRMANLLATYSVPREARVALLLLDTVDFPVAFWGSIKAGVIPVALNTLLTSEQYAYILSDSRVRALIVSAPLLPVLQPILGQLPFLKHIFVCGGEPPPFALPFRGELELQGAAYKAADTCCDETAFWLYSSGSTGMPKGVRHVHSSLMETARLCGQQCLGMRADDLVYSAAKLFFAYGLGNSLLFPFSVGATAVLDPARATPGGAAERLAADRPTLFFAGPAFFAALLNADAPAEAFGTVRLATSAGEALPAEIYRRFTTRYGVDIIDGLGSTEALHIFISNRPGAVRPGTSGTVVPGYEARLVDDAGAPVADGEPGHLLVRGDSIATGYWCRTATSREVFQGEWLRTGDTYTRSADGFYTCLGRSNDMIKASGIWVSPMEVEGRLLAHPSVAECAVVGHRNAAGLEEVVACVVAAPGQSVDADGLIAFCREGLASFKRPRRVLALDALPKTATGKIQRVVVREVVAQRLGEPGG